MAQSWLSSLVLVYSNSISMAWSNWLRGKHSVSSENNSYIHGFRQIFRVAVIVFNDLFQK